MCTGSVLCMIRFHGRLKTICWARGRGGGGVEEFSTYTLDKFKRTGFNYIF